MDKNNSPPKQKRKFRRYQVTMTEELHDWAVKRSEAMGLASFTAYVRVLVLEDRRAELMKAKQIEDALTASKQ